MSKSSDPADVTGAAETEGEYAQQIATQATYADRPTQTSALGSIEYGTSESIDPATGLPVTIWEQNNVLSPELQSIVDANLTGAEASMSSSADFDQFGDIEAWNWDGDAERQAAEDASYEKSTSRLDPQYEAELNALDIQLRNQGLMPGDAAYESQMDIYNTGKNDAYEQARLGSVAEGSDAYQQSFDTAMQSNELSNALRDKEIEEYLMERGYSLSEIQSVTDLITGAMA